MTCTEEVAVLQSWKRSVTPSPGAAKKKIGVILMELLLALAAGAVGLALFAQAKALPSEVDFKKAKEKLDANPVDPDANTTVGKYTAFVLGDYAAAMPYLVHSSDKTLRTIAEHELDDTYIDTAVKKVGMGDEWVIGAKKFPVLSKIFYDRAAQWYGQAWPALDGVWKDRTREQLRKLFQNSNVSDPKTINAPAGWKANEMTQKGAATTKSARNGKASFQVVAVKGPQPLPIVLEQTVQAAPGKAYELSAWVLPDGTESANDQITAIIYGAGDAVIDVKRLILPKDEPWWHRLENKFTTPADTVALRVIITPASKVGNIFIDDLSIKTDGKEMLKNSSFEDK